MNSIRDMMDENGDVPTILRQRKPVVITGEKPKSWLEQKLALRQLGMSDDAATAEPERASLGQVARDLGDFVPVASEGLALDRAKNDFEEGNYGSAAMNAAFGVLPFGGAKILAAGLPLVPKGARALLAKGASKVGKKAAQVMDTVMEADPVANLEAAADGIKNLMRRTKVPNGLPTAQLEEYIASKTPLGTMFDEFTPAQSRDLARREWHIKPMEGGGYEGLPEHIKTPEDLARLRDRVDNLAVSGSGNAPWYDEASDYYAKIHGYDPATMTHDSPKGRQLGTYIKGSAIHSAMRSPLAEANDALKVWNEKVWGNRNVNSATGPQAERFLAGIEVNPKTGVREFFPERLGGGDKTGLYSDARDKSVADVLGGPLDRREGEAFEFNVGTESTEKRSQFTPREHTAVHGEQVLSADRLDNAGHTFPRGPGADPMLKREASNQAMRWEGVTDDELKRARAAGENTLTDEQIKRTATSTIPDAYSDKWGYTTQETGPAARERLFSGTDKLSPEQQVALEHDLQALFYPDKSRQTFADASHLVTDEGRQGIGQWGAEQNPMTAYPVAVPPRNGALEQTSRDILRTLAGVEAALAGQSMGGASMFLRKLGGTPLKKLTGARITAGDPAVLRSIQDALARDGTDVAHVGDALTAGKFEVPGEVRDAKAIQANIAKTLSDKGLSGQAVVEPGMLESVSYEPKYGKPGGGTMAKDLIENLLAKESRGFKITDLWDQSPAVKQEIQRRQAGLRDLSQKYGVDLDPYYAKFYEMLADKGFTGMRAAAKAAGSWGKLGVPAIGLMTGGGYLGSRLGQQNEP